MTPLPPAASESDPVSVVQSGLTAQRALLEQLLVLARGQSALIESAEHDSLIALVHRREAIVSQLEGIRTAMTPALADLSDSPETLPEAVRGPMREAIARIQILVGEIAVLDETDSGRIRGDLDRCRASLESITTTQRAQQRYRPSPAPQATFADAQG